MMKQFTETNREKVSALTDGELRGDEFAQTLDGMGQSEEARQTWHTYHLVGDVLRAGQAVDSSKDAAFMTRFKQSLSHEAAVKPAMNAAYLIAGDADNTGARSQFDSKNESANQSNFRWKLLAGVASLATVTVMAWQAMTGLTDQGGAPQLARESTGQPALTLTQVATGDTAVMIRDPQLDALMAAHRQFGGTSALQMPAGFLRNATFEGAAR